MEFILAPEIKSELNRIVNVLGLNFVKTERIIAFRSFGSKSRAIARIWSLPRIWQLALNTQAHYCIEVISEKYDKLSNGEQERVLIHEILHIPKNFSGALLPHKQRSKRIDTKTVKRLHLQLQKNLKNI